MALFGRKKPRDGDESAQPDAELSDGIPALQSWSRPSWQTRGMDTEEEPAGQRAAEPAAPTAPSPEPSPVDQAAPRSEDGRLETTFRLRLERYDEDLRRGLEAVYGERAEETHRRVLEVIARAMAARPQELRDLDEARLLRPDWLQQPSQLAYVAYADRFAGSLQGVREHLDHLEALDVTHLHLMPLLQPRPGNSDGGYAVMDYRAVREDLGSMEDLRGLASDLHERGMSLELDLVLNHVAREHEWARRARAGEERYREYFLTFPDRTEPDRWEESLPEVFPDFAPGNFTWDEEMGRWVWTTFHDFQWDLNWANPDVFVEFADIVLHLANQGADVLRLDAIAFIWKRLGTTSQNLPEVHSLTRALRAVARIAAPALALKAEAIVGPQDLIGYLGRGENAGKLSDTAYHNSLMVQLWSALAARDTRLLRVALEKLPVKPASTTWSTYIRCHDDIGWAVTDEDAADAGLHGPSHRAFLSDFYAGEFPGSFAEGLVFQHDPATGDKRISGTLASLAGLERALAAHDGTGDARAIELAVRRILLLHAAMLGFGGVPLLYMGDELALLNDHAWAGEPGHEDDNRWVHRPRMDWDEAARVLDAVAERTAARGDTDAAEESPGCAPAWAVALSSAEEPAVRVLAGTRHLARVRSALPQLHAAVESRVLEAGDDRLLLWLREHPEGAMVQVMNVSESAVELDPAALRAHLGARPREAITQARWNLEVGSLQVQPYQTLWFLGGA